MRLGTKTRSAMIDLASRILIGGGVPAAERAWVRSELRLSGFRKTARSYLLRRMARSALAQGDVTILAAALEGSFTIACSATDFGVGWEVLERGTYEPHIVSFYRRFIRPGMVVADIGANIGFHALHAATLVGPSGRVVAVEPDPRSVSLMKLSLSLNSPALPMEIVAAALSDAQEDLIHTDLGNAGNSGARFTHRSRSRLERLVHGVAPVYRTVRAIRWDDHYLDLPVSLVKIDIEGFEPHALRGMERSLMRQRPVILSEFAPSNLESLGETEPRAYLAWMRSRGYGLSVLENEGVIPLRGDNDVMACLRGRHHVDLVLTPEG